MKMGNIIKQSNILMTIALFIIVVAFLVGCAGLPTQEEIASADHGSYPNNYEDIVKSYYARVLKDPYSVKYESISTPQRYWVGNRIEGATFGYLVCVTLNAKNSYGAYVGYETDGLIIKNGLVIKYIEKGRWGDKMICY